MNENINLVEILKDCPKGTKLYSPMFGEVEFVNIDNNDIKYPINVTSQDLVSYPCFSSSGTYLVDSNYKPIGECTLFPSKDQRDWSKFKLPKKECEFEPFQKVLVRDNDYNKWKADFFSHYQENTCYPYICVGAGYNYCIPYEDNEHLLGTKNNPELTEGGEE